MSKAVVFKDRVRLHVRAGRGGDGAASFRREKFVPRGGPDGGDGGRGGHVILRADPQVDSLLPLYFQPHQRAEDGGRGRGKQMHGRNGADLTLPVPCGTVVREHPSGTLLGEVVEPGGELMVARGGRGGWGNMHFATPTHQAPREHVPGDDGEARTLDLELKLVADVGLVGYPNAGKSTLLRALTDARPKVAPYPFTTLNPLRGTLIYDDFASVTLADVPGLIQGAHAGVGLGHEFLRHLERTRALLFVIDLAATDGRDPTEDFRSLREELRLHDPALAERPYAVVANKLDDPGAAERLAAFRRETGEAPMEVIAELAHGLDPVKAWLRQWAHGP